MFAKIQSIRLPQNIAPIVEQALNGLTNIVLIALYSRDASLEEVGVFSLMIVALQLTTMLVRGVCSSVLLSTVVSRSSTSATYSVSLLAGLCVGISLCFISIHQDQPILTNVLWVWAGVLILVHDGFRYLVFQRLEYNLAAKAGVVWAIVMALVYVFLKIIVWQDNLQITLLAWLLGGSSAALYLSRQLDLNFSINEVLSFSRNNRKMQITMLFETLAESATALSAIGFIAVFGTMIDVGIIRIAQTVASPVAVVLQGLQNFAVPKVTKYAHIELNRESNIKSVEYVLFKTIVLFSMAFLIALYLFGDSFGAIVFGGNWVHSSQLVGLLVIMTFVNGLSVPIVSTLRGLSKNNELRRTRLISSVVIIVGQIVGYISFGAVGFGVFGIISVSIAMVIWFGVRRGLFLTHQA